MEGKNSCWNEKGELLFELIFKDGKEINRIIYEQNNQLSFK